MATPVSNEQDTASNTATNPNFTLDAGAVNGDVLLLICVNDFYALANLTSPTGTAVTTWGLQGSGDGGTNHNHFKAWTGSVTTNTGTVLTNWSTAAPDEERYAALLRFPSGTSFDGSAFTGPGTSSTTQPAPSVTATSGQTDDMLICVWTVDGGTGSSTYSPPGSMTGGTTRSLSPFFSGLAAWEQLASATSGTRTPTVGTAHTWDAFSVLMKNAGTAAVTPPVLIPPQAAVRASFW